MDIGPHMIESEIVNRVQRREVDLLGDAFAGFDLNRGLGQLSVSFGDWLTLTTGNFKTEPHLFPSVP